jgi:hypothetical protein
MKNIAASSLFYLLFVASDKEQVVQRGFFEKNDMRPPRMGKVE